jgi:maleylpyruvate isomerase
MAADDRTGPARVGAADVAELRRRQAAATAGLLAETAGLDEEGWRRPSALPGWQRAHVASHLARHAEALAGWVGAQLAGRPGLLYASREARDRDIEVGAGRPAAELQADLVDSAAALERALDAVPPTAWARTGEPRAGFSLELGLLPLMRLTEVALHRVDLGLGARVEDLPAGTALPVLDYLGRRQRGRTDYPAVELVPAEAPGRSVLLGSPAAAPPRRVLAPAALLVGLLTRRTPPDRVPGAAGLRLPALG